MAMATRRVHRRGSAQLYVGVFFLFAPIGILIGLAASRPFCWGYGLAMACFTGLVSVLWMGAFRERLFWLLIPANVLPFAGPWVYFLPLERLGLLSAGASISEDWRRATLAIAAGACLTLGFYLMARFIRRSERAAAAARAELDVAKRIHDTLVPTLRESTASLDILGVSEPSSEMGGDLIDVVTRDGVTDVVVADVSGHGVGAGIVMAMTKGSLRTRMLAGGDVACVASDVNTVLATLTSTSMFVTGVLLRLNGSGGAECVVAGHPPLLIVRPDGTIQRIESRSMPMAIDASDQPQAEHVRVEPGSLLVLLTDGLTETKDSRGRMLGMEPIQDFIREHRGESLESLITGVMNLVRSHGPQEDDRSLVLVRAK